MRLLNIKILTGFLRRKSVIFLLLLLFLYKATFNIFTGNFLFSYIFKNFSTGSYSGNVKQFSLFYGIEIDSLEIRSGQDFNNEIIFSTQRIAILYNLPLIFIGKLKLTEISLTKPFIQILEKNQKLNVLSLFPTDSNAKPKPEPKETSSSEEINLYLPVSAYLNFFIEDLTFRMEKEAGENYFFTEEKNIDFKVLIATKRFRKIPLNMDIVSIFETIQISLNPTQNLSVNFKDNFNQVNQGFSTSLLLDLDSDVTPPKFNSNLNLGSDQIQLLVKNKKLPTFGFIASYEMNYLPKEDTLELPDLSIIFNNMQWLKAKGKILNALTENREMDFQILHSDIDLQPVSAIYKQIPGLPNLDFKGKVNLAPISIKGKMDSLEAIADIKIRDVLFKQNNTTHNVPFLNLKAESELDLRTNKLPTKENPIPILKSLNLKTDFSYNTLLADLFAEIISNQKIYLLLNVKNIFLRNFVPELNGKLTGNVLVEGNSFEDLTAKLTSSINSLEYTVTGSKSGINNIDLSILTKVALGENFSFQSAKINSISLKQKNKDHQEATTLSIKGNIELNPLVDLHLEALKLNVNLDRLIPTLPLSLKEQIAPLKKTLGAQTEIEGKVHYKDFIDSFTADGNLNVSLPGISLNDFHSDFSVKIAKDNSGEISISKFIFSGFGGLLKGNINGNLIKRAIKEKPPLGPYYPSLKANISLASENQTEIVKGIKFDGKIGIALQLQDFSAKGNIFSTNSNFVYYSGTCNENDFTTCNLVYINKINIDFPFEHNLKVATTKNLIEGNKSKFINTYGQNQPSNFTIENVIGTHPYIDTELFKLLQEKGNKPGLSARLDYKENVLTINPLKISLLDGFIFGKDILLNIGNANIEDMEYAATIQIKDIDLKQLLPSKSRKEISDGKIKADINLSGKNLKDPIANLNLFFSVFQIGEDFGKSAIRIVSPPNLLTDGIIGSYSKINKIEVELSKGLIYADILFQRSILSTVFIGIDNNKISQERMPLANFLNRAQSEVSKYE